MKHYYSDLALAAYMHRQFCVRLGFYQMNGVFQEYHPAIQGYEDLWRILSNRIYVHADSLRIFDVVEGDIAIVHPDLGDLPKNDPGWKNQRQVGWVGHWRDWETDEIKDPNIFVVSDSANSSLGLVRHKRLLEPIQRDGMPFICPIVET